MSKFLENLWKNQRTMAIILGIILLPLTLIILAVKFYSMYNLHMAKKSLEEAQIRDNELKAQEDELKRKANVAVSDANKAAKKIEDRKNEEVDLDWNKKRND